MDHFSSSLDVEISVPVFLIFRLFPDGLLIFKSKPCLCRLVGISLQFYIYCLFFVYPHSASKQNNFLHQFCLAQGPKALSHSLLLSQSTSSELAGKWSNQDTSQCPNGNLEQLDTGHTSAGRKLQFPGGSCLPSKKNLDLRQRVRYVSQMKAGTHSVYTRQTRLVTQFRFDSPICIWTGVFLDMPAGSTFLPLPHVFSSGVFLGGRLSGCRIPKNCSLGCLSAQCCWIQCRRDSSKLPLQEDWDPPNPLTLLVWSQGMCLHFFPNALAEKFRSFLCPLTCKLTLLTTKNIF